MFIIKNKSKTQENKINSSTNACLEREIKRSEKLECLCVHSVMSMLQRKRKGKRKAKMHCVHHLQDLYQCSR